MFTNMHFRLRNRRPATILATMGWLILMFGWLVFAWGRYSFFQGLIGLGISTLLFAAAVGVMWVVEQSRTLAAAILTTLGWLSFALYWIGFVWSRYTLLQNGAVLVVSLFVGMGAILALWQRGERMLGAKHDAKNTQRRYHV